jgi:hypothetical protein
VHPDVSQVPLLLPLLLLMLHQIRLGGIVVNLLWMLLLVLLGRTAPQKTQWVPLLLLLLCASASADAAVLR